MVKGVWRGTCTSTRVKSPENLGFPNYLKAFIEFSEAVAQRCSVKKVLLEISQNSQENTCARASFLIKLQASLQLY